jgi:hypothetical protein
VSEVRRSAGLLATLAAGAVIGAIEAVLAISFAALVFGGHLASFLADGIGLYLTAAALTLAILAGGRVPVAWSAACRTRRRRFSPSLPRTRPLTPSGASTARS